MTDVPGLLDDYLGRPVVIDLRSPFVCLGTLSGADGGFLEVRDADLHDLRDGRSSREIYVYESARIGIRRNRSRVLVRRDEIVAVTLLADISEE